MIGFPGRKILSLVLDVILLNGMSKEMKNLPLSITKFNGKKEKELYQFGIKKSDWVYFLAGFIFSLFFGLGVLWMVSILQGLNAK